jgi:uncharacterized protein YodC (DUF2158 family)
MTVIKSGDLVVLKSGGPTMTVDTVNTDIFDDDKITGVLCVWFVGEKLERVRFDHRAIEPVQVQKTSPEKNDVRLEEATGDYKIVLDEMVAALNIPAGAKRDASKAVAKQPRPVPAAKPNVTAPPVANAAGTRTGGPA